MTAHDLVKKHIQHPDHVITDDEFRNIQVAGAATDRLEIEKEVDAKKEELVTKHDNDSLPNPYSVIG